MKISRFIKSVGKTASAVFQFCILPTALLLWLVSAFVLAEPWMIALIQKILEFYDYVIELLEYALNTILAWKRLVALCLSGIGALLLFTGTFIRNSRYTEQGRKFIIALGTTSCAAGIAIWRVHGLPTTDQSLLQELFKLQSLFLAVYLLLWLIHFFVKQEVTEIDQPSPADHVRLVVMRLATCVKNLINTLLRR